MTRSRVYSLLLSLPEWALPLFNGCAREADDQSDEAEAERYAILYSDVAVGWKAAKIAADNGLPMPGYQEPGDEMLYRAYLYNCNPRLYKDVTIQRALSLTRPGMRNIASGLRALLIPKDSSIRAVAAATGIEEDVVLAYEKLFFNVMDRKQDAMFIRNIVYPQGRIVEYFEGYLRSATFENLMLRAGFKNGMEDVLHFAGFPTLEMDDVNSADAARRLEGRIMAQGYLMIRNGWHNQKDDSAGLIRSCHLLSAAKIGGEKAQDADTDLKTFAELLGPEIYADGDRKAARKIRNQQAAFDAIDVASQPV